MCKSSRHEEEVFDEGLEGLLINMIAKDDETKGRFLALIRPCLPGEQLTNWTMVDLPGFTRHNTE